MNGKKLKFENMFPGINMMLSVRDVMNHRMRKKEPSGSLTVEGSVTEWSISPHKGALVREHISQTRVVIMPEF